MGGRTLRVNFYGSEGKKRKKSFAYWVKFFFLFSLHPSQDKMQTIISNEIRKGVIVPGRGRERLWGDPCQWCSVTTLRAVNSPRKALCGTDSFALIWLDFVFSLGDKFFHFLALKRVSTMDFEAVLSQREHSVPYCAPVEWNAVLSPFLSLLRCSVGYIARKRQHFLRNVNDTNQSLVFRPHTEPWKFWESNNRDATAKDQKQHLGGAAVRTAAWSTLSL